jgi:hypothetical protein
MSHITWVLVQYKSPQYPNAESILNESVQQIKTDIPVN